MREVYLDAAASYPPGKTSSVSSWVANPHSLHMSGGYARHMIVETENSLRKKLDVTGGKFHWTGSGSEANRLAIESFCERGGLVTSELEHKSIRQLVRRYGISADATPEGCVNYNSLEKLCGRFTSLVSVMLANNETGVINTDSHLARDFKAPQALFHTDISQAFCKIPITASFYDLVTFSAHKIGGPKGLGCLWVSDHARGTIPYLGTPSPEAIWALKCAVESFPDYDVYQKHMEDLSNTFMQTLRWRHAYENGQDLPRVPGLLSISFTDPYIDAVELMMILTSKGIHVSTGAACNNKIGERSHVLEAMGMSAERIDSTIRVSFNHHQTVEDIKYAAQIIEETVEEIRSGS